MTTAQTKAPRAKNKASLAKKNSLPALPFAVAASHSFHENAEVTVLSYGGGQDSTCILYKIIYDPLFAARYVRGRLIVVMADTGDEHDYTYQYVEHVREVCRKAGIEFYFITSQMGFHSPSWLSLRGQMEKNRTILGKAFARSGSCTDNLKIKPIYRFLAHYIYILPMGLKRWASG